MGGTKAAADRGRGGRAHRTAEQPGPGDLPRAGVHQGGRLRLLPRGRRRDHARPAGPPDHAAALPRGRRGRGVLPEAGADPGRAAVGDDRADHLPERPQRRRSSARPTWRTWPGPRRWARSSSTRGRCAPPTSTAPTSCASTSTRSPAPTSPTRRGAAGEVRALLDELGVTGWPKTSGGRGVHVYLRIAAPLDVHRGAPGHHRAGPGGGAPPPRPGHHRLVEGGARRAGSSSTSTRWPATARSPARTRCGPTPGPPSRPRSPGTSCPTSTRTTSTCAPCRRGSPRSATRTPASTTRRGTSRPLLEWAERDAADGQGDLPYPPDHPKMPGEPKRVQPSRAKRTPDSP